MQKLVPCPTCGSACRVYSGDEGTNSFDPVTPYRAQNYNAASIDTVIDLMNDDTQPQRALHNWLREFVKTVGDITVTVNGKKITAYPPDEVVGWIRQFCNMHNDIEE